MSCAAADENILRSKKKKEKYNKKGKALERSDYWFLTFTWIHILRDDNAMKVGKYMQQRNKQNQTYTQQFD